MNKDLMKIIDNNIKYLKSCLDLTEAHITWGTKDVKEKYIKIKDILNIKLNEQYTDKRVLTERYNQEVQNSIELSNLLSTI
jgi:hypothetical protein|tara:strand:- start:464 stop:706 length:243 start_codon:yes stop_codon:yes gene_type:complete